MTLARTQAILTELIFEHSFRIRFKAEATSSKPATVETSGGAPDPDPSAEGSEDTQSVETENTSTSAKGKGKMSPTTPPSEAEADTKKKDNLIGKLNTMVSVDLDNVFGAKDFLMVRKSTRLYLFVVVQSLLKFFHVNSGSSTCGTGFGYGLPLSGTGMEVRNS